MRLAFRCDDIGVSANPQFLDIEKRVFGLFLEQNVPLVIGVVPSMAEDFFDPDNVAYASLATDEERMAMVDSALSRGFQMGLHGLNHRVARRGFKSEFAGVAREEQTNKIEEGLELLGVWFPDAPVDVFIPPWNTYDDNTIKATADSGIAHLSAGDSSSTLDDRGVTVSSSVPIGAFFELLEFMTIEQLAGQVGDRCLVVTFHAYQFLELDPNFEMAFDDFAKRLGHIVDAGIPIVTLDPSLDADQMTPKASWLLDLRVAALIKTRRLGRVGVAELGRTVKRRFGATPARLVVDAGAISLFWLPLLRKFRGRGVEPAGS